MVSRNEIQLLRSELETELKNILNYWTTRMVDNERGGFYGRRDGFDVLQPEAEKGIILNTRILWTFSQAAREVSDAHLTVAGRAYEYIRQHFVDRDKGGVYWMLDSNGMPVSTRKQIYAQAFAIYALSEYYLATKDPGSLELAIDLFRLIEKHSFDKQYNGYLEAFDRDWNTLDDMRLSEKDANEKKTMNTHLHVLESYTNLYRCWPDAGLKHALVNLISVFQDRIINSDSHFTLFFDEKWNVKSHEISYGHDIEGSWLLHEAAETVGLPEVIRKAEETAVAMVDVTVNEGLDSDGGVMNEANDPDKHWWPQAEALVGLINAWQLTGKDIYFANALKVWRFIQNRLLDRENGEWFWRVNREGVVKFSEDKAGPWKCPYHNGRAMMELLRRLPK